MEGDNATYQEEVFVFERATRTVRGQLLKTANGYLHNAEEAEDAVQETLTWLSSCPKELSSTSGGNGPT